MPLIQAKIPDSQIAVITGGGHFAEACSGVLSPNFTPDDRSQRRPRQQDSQA